MVFRVQISVENIGKAASRCTDFFMLNRLFLRVQSRRRDAIYSTLEYCHT